MNSLVEKYSWQAEGLNSNLIRINSIRRSILYHQKGMQYLTVAESVLLVIAGLLQYRAIKNLLGPHSVL
jgi:hypothetical protein